MNNKQKNFNLNNFFSNIKLKKQYIKKLQNKVILVDDLKVKNYKKLSPTLLFMKKPRYNLRDDFLVKYIIDITFSRSNTFVNLMDFSGKLIFFCSAGTLQFKGKNKKSRYSVFKKIYRVLVSKFCPFKNQPVALHLKNVSFAKFWIIKLLKKKFFIKVVRNFNTYSYNGCRKKKVIRKKFKKRRNG